MLHLLRMSGVCRRDSSGAQDVLGAVVADAWGMLLRGWGTNVFRRWCVYATTPRTPTSVTPSETTITMMRIVLTSSMFVSVSDIELGGRDQGLEVVV